MVFSMITMLLFSCVLAMPGLFTDQPKATLPQARTGPDLRHVFPLRNAGSHEITITKLESGCGCTKPTASRTTLKPGETSDVTLTIRTLTQPAGDQTWKARVEFSETGQVGVLELSVSAKLVREVSVTPPQLAISTTHTATQTITVTDIRTTKLQVLRATTTHPKLRLKASTTGVFTSELEVPAEFPVGHFQEEIILTTNDPTCPELHIPVTIVKSRPDGFRVLPEVPTIRFNPDQAESSVLVQVRRVQAAEFEFTSVTTDVPGIRLKPSEKPGLVGAIRITADRASLPQVRGQGVVKVKIGTETLTIPFLWDAVPPLE
ncbi:MAG: DUF1573 domain-containing protein [Fimbriiglobus sp.]